MVSSIFLGLLLSVTSAGSANPHKNFYSFNAKSIEGKPVLLSKYKGKVSLVVNTASKCGYTPQYKALEEIYKKYQSKGFVVLGFPSNDFLSQEPGTNSEIKQFCQSRYGVTFPLFEKNPVKGSEKQLIYKYLTEESGADFQGEIHWNFNKFLVNKDGDVVARFGSAVKPSDAEVTSSIEKLLK
ncbi:MAG: glutathione peroxidase [Bacteriovoracaceae bacterium]|nr:glutathione peroxidase [Bacteriovoracaceae bacterium]